MAETARTVVTLSVGPLAADELRVARVQGREALSEPFVAEVDFEPTGDEPLATADLAGEEAQLTFTRPDGTERFVHGVAEVVELRGVREGQPYYRLRLVPRVALLAHRRNSRVFQEQTVPEVVEQVLSEGEVELRLDLQGSYAPREYCVQYRETDLSFVSRLLAEEGITWFFEQADGAHTLVLCDTPQSFADIPGDPVIPFRPPQVAGEATEDEHLSAYSRTGRVRTDKATLRDYDQKRPALDLTAEAEEGDAALEVYEYRLRYADPGELKRLAGSRLEQSRVAASLFEGEANSLRLAPGFCFEPSEHADDAMNLRLQTSSLDYLALRPEQQGQEAAVGLLFRCRFLAQESGTPYRPPRALAKPVVVGAQTAVVVGPSGEEIHDDKIGSIKVQFHWDRKGEKDDHSSCFVRVAQRWAGPGWGASFVPRIGQEVLVRFLEGDPDRPLVVGAVYNGKNAPPIALPDDKTRSTLRSDSSPGDDGYNELRFEDLKGSEEVYVHAQKDETIAVENDKRQKVGADESLEVAKDRTQQVKGGQSLRVAVNDASAVEGNRSLTVQQSRGTLTGMSHDETVGGSQSITVGGSQTTLVATASAVTVGAAAALTIGGGYLVTVGGVHNTAVGGARLEQVGGARTSAIFGSQEESVEEDHSIQVGGDFTIDVTDGVEAVADKDQKEELDAKAGVEVKKETAWLMKSLQLEADDLKIVVGGKLLLRMQKSGDLTFSASKFTLDASGNLTTKGSQVKMEAGSGPSSGSASVAEAKKLEKADKSVQVAFKLADGSSALVGLAFELTLPDGSKKKGEVAPSGLAFGGVMPGSCKLAFTALDEEGG